MVVAEAGAIVVHGGVHGCCCCFQSSRDHIPWLEHDEETRQPMGRFCWACGDVIFKHYPYLSKEAAREKASEERFRTQVVRMARIKLGADAKDFYPQEVLASWTAGWRVEEDVRLSSGQEFKKSYGEAPETVAGANCVPFPTGRGEQVSYWVDRDPSARPKVTMWYEGALSCNEQRMSKEDQLEEGQGQSKMNMELPGFLHATFGSKSVPTVMELQAQVAAMKGKAAGKGGGGAPVLALLAPAPSAVDPPRPGGSKRKRPVQEGGRELQVRSSQGKRGKSTNDYSVMPSISSCLLNQHGVPPLTGAQVLYHCHQHFEGSHKRGEIDALAFRTKSKEYTARTCASAMAPGAIEKASDDELLKCYATVLDDKSEKALPVRFWFNLMQRQFKKLSATKAWKSNSDKVFAFADPRAKKEATSWDAVPEALQQIPLEKLGATERWALAEQLWIELLFPTLLSSLPNDGGETVPADVKTLLVCYRGFQEAADQSETPRTQESANLLQCFALCGAPWQDSPLRAEQMRLLQQAASPDEAPKHVQVLVQIFDSSWQKVIRTAMQFTIAEVQHEGDIDHIVSTLRQVGQEGSSQKESGEASELATFQEVWGRWTSRNGWNMWRDMIRPRVVKVLRKALVDSFHRCLNASSPELVSELVRVSAWMEAHDLQESTEWGALHQKAQEKHLQATSTARIETLVTVMQTCVARDDHQAFADPVEPEVEALITACSASKGLSLAQAQVPLLYKASRLALGCDPMANSIAELVDELWAMKPRDEAEPEDAESVLLGTAIQTVKFGVPLLNSMAGNGPEEISSSSEKQLAKFKSAREKYQEAWTNASHEAEPGIVGVWEDMNEAAEKVSASQAAAVAKGKEQKEAKMKGKLDELEIMLERCRWQKNLPSEPTWTDVVREIEYTFWQRTVSGDASELAASGQADKGKKAAASVMDKLESLFAEVEKLWNEYAEHCRQSSATKPGSLSDAWDRMSVACKVLNTEEYCVRQYVEKEDASRGKLSKRQAVAAGAKFWSDVHPTIAGKVKEITGM